MEYESYVMVHEDNRTMLGLALRDKTSKIRKITVAPHESGDVIYLFYDKKEVLVEQESRRLASLRSIAFGITKNAVYSKLTNAKQRNIYLREFCHISKSDAEDVIELVKIIEVDAKAMAELKEEEARHRKVMAEELTERQKAIDRERKENERIHERDMKQKRKNEEKNE